MTEIWKKADGSVYRGQSVTLDGRRIFNPTAAQLAQAGYSRHEVQDDAAPDMDPPQADTAQDTETQQKNIDIRQNLF